MFSQSWIDSWQKGFSDRTIHEKGFGGVADGGSLALGIHRDFDGHFFIGRLVESDPLFPNRTNVEFVEVLEEGGIKARIWERGVGETPASGTGATAAAYIAHTVADVAAPVDVHLRGGVLTISFNEEGAWMEGPAETVFTGSVD